MASHHFLKKLNSVFIRIQHVFQVGITENHKKVYKCRFPISIRDPAIWNDLVGNTEKEIHSSCLSKNKIKSKLLNFDNEVILFLYLFPLKTHFTKETADDNDVL